MRIDRCPIPDLDGTRGGRTGCRILQRVLALIAGLLITAHPPLTGQSPDEVLDSLAAAVNRADFEVVDSLFAGEAQVYPTIPFGFGEPAMPTWLDRPSTLYRGLGFTVGAEVTVEVTDRLTTTRFASEHVRVTMRQAESSDPYVWSYFAMYQFDGAKIWRMWRAPEVDSSHVPAVTEPAFGGDQEPVVVFDGAHGNLRILTRHADSEVAGLDNAQLP